MCTHVPGACIKVSVTGCILPSLSTNLSVVWAHCQYPHDYKQQEMDFPSCFPCEIYRRQRRLERIFFLLLIDTVIVNAVISAAVVAVLLLLPASSLLPFLLLLSSVAAAATNVQLNQKWVSVRTCKRLKKRNTCSVQ